MQESLAKQREWNTFECLRTAKQIVLAEQNAIQRLAENLPVTLYDAVELIYQCEGSVIVTGIGKAGWIGQKISASLASTGTPSHFLHPSEAMHGDLGRVTDRDVILVLSNSGNTAEVTQILKSLQKRNLPIIALTANENNELARAADVVLDYGNVNEACHLGLAPSTSTTLMLVLGDALCLATAQRREFTPADFVNFHPGGTLGLKLSKVEEIMRSLRSCRIADQTLTVRQVFTKLASNERRSGAVLLVDQDGKLTGVFTDSDLARLLEQQRDDSLDLPIQEVMTQKPKTVAFGSPTPEAVATLAKHNISELPVVDRQGKPIGIIDITDVLNLLPKN